MMPNLWRDLVAPGVGNDCLCEGFVCQGTAPALAAVIADEAAQLKTELTAPMPMGRSAEHRQACR